MSGNTREGWGHWAARMIKLAAHATFRVTFTPFPILNQGLVRTLIGTDEDPRLLHLASYALCGQACHSWEEVLARLPAAAQQQFDVAAIRDDEVRRQQSVAIQNYRELLMAPQPIVAGMSNQLGEIVFSLCADLFETYEDGENHQDIRLRPSVSEDQLKLSKALISICIGYTVVLEKFRHKTLRQEVWNAVRSFFNNRYALMQQLSHIERDSFIPILKPAFTEWLQSLKVPLEIIQEIFDPDIQTLVGEHGLPIARVRLRETTKLLLIQHYPEAYFLYQKSFQTAYQETNVPFLGWMLRLSQFLIILLPTQLASGQPLFMQALTDSFGKNWEQLDDFLNRIEQLMGTLSQSIQYREGGDLLYPAGLFGNDTAMSGLLKTVDNNSIIPPMLGKAVHMIRLVRDILSIRRTVFSGTQARGRVAGSPPVPFPQQALVLTEKLRALSMQNAQDWRYFCEQRQFQVEEASSPLSIYALIHETFDEKILDALRKSPEYFAKLPESKQNYHAIIQSFSHGSLFQAEGFLLDIIDETIQAYCEKQPAGSVSKLMITRYLNMNPVDKAKARQQLTAEQKKEIFGRLFEELILVEKDTTKQRQLVELKKGTHLVYTSQDPNISEGHFRQLVKGLITHDDDPAFAAELRKHCVNVEEPTVGFDLKDTYHEQLACLKTLQTTQAYAGFIRAIQKTNDYFNNPDHGRRLQTKSYAGRFSYSRHDCDERMKSWKDVLDNLSSYLKEPSGIKKLERFLLFLDQEIYKFKGFHVPFYGKLNWFCKQDWEWEGANWVILRMRFRSLLKSFRRFTCLHSRYANHLIAVRSTFKNLIYLHEVQPQVAAQDPIDALRVFNVVSLRQLEKACPQVIAELAEEERDWLDLNVGTAQATTRPTMSRSSSTDSFVSADDADPVELSVSAHGVAVKSTAHFPEQRHFNELASALETVSTFYETGYRSYNPKETPAAGNQLVFRVWRNAHDSAETILDTLEEVKLRQAALLQAQEGQILSYWRLASCNMVQKFDVVRLNNAPNKPSI